MTISFEKKNNHIDENLEMFFLIRQFPIKNRLITI